MSDISIQFHAIPEELLSLVRRFVEDFHLHVVAIRFFPFGAAEVAIDDLDRIFVAHSKFRRLEFTHAPPSLPVKDELDFADKNPDSLRLDIGMRVEKGLEQSWLTARPSHKEAFAAWRMVARRLRKMTESGVVATNPQTGATVAVRSYRYSSGAKALERIGVAMLPPAGTSVLKLGSAGRAGR